jgi:hypothetical protein
MSIRSIPGHLKARTDDSPYRFQMYSWHQKRTVIQMEAHPESQQRMTDRQYTSGTATVSLTGTYKCCADISGNQGEPWGWVGWFTVAGCQAAVKFAKL